jgi:hypothetical protein
MTRDGRFSRIDCHISSRLRRRDRSMEARASLLLLYLATMSTQTIGEVTRAYNLRLSTVSPLFPFPNLVNGSQRRELFQSATTRLQIGRVQICILKYNKPQHQRLAHCTSGLRVHSFVEHELWKGEGEEQDNYNFHYCIQYILKHK